MTKPKISRRDFMKMAGAGALSTAVLTGCGTASRYVTREPYVNMPEYTLNGESTFFATTCQECSAGCGIIVRTFQGRAIKVEGNPYHPVSQGKTCARGQAALHGLYNPDRVQFPTRQNRSTELSTEAINWDEGISQVAAALSDYQPDEIAILMGETADHIYDIAAQLTLALNAPQPIRFSALNMFEARQTLQKAAGELYGRNDLLYFDIENTDLILSFGASFLETWISPFPFTRQYSNFRKGDNRVRGYMVHFEARMSQTAAVADEWIPIVPGTESFVALALGRLIAEKTGNLPAQYNNINPEEYAKIAGIEFTKLDKIADTFVTSESPLAIPGNWAMGQINGVDNAKSILSLNQFHPGGQGLVHFPPESAINDSSSNHYSVQDIQQLIEKMKAGQVKVLMVHGVNPIFEVPKSYGFAEALKEVDLVISFASFPDETALMADYILPDHTGLESWGYHHVPTGVDKKTLSGSQPVVVPFYNTRATGDVLLAVAQIIGGDVAGALPYEDEVSFIQEKLNDLLGENSELINAGEIRTFSAQFQQFGGWWEGDPSLETLPPTTYSVSSPSSPKYQGEGEFHLVPFMSPTLAEKGANKPWLQETPDPTTTVMWNTWVEINPHTAEELGIQDDDIVRIISPAGEIEAPVYLYPAIRPDTIALPFGQGHTAYGRYAENRGSNPADLLEDITNPAGDLVFSTTKVEIAKTGKVKQLARLESRIGVYGFEEE